jgi:FkbM family methyltransferase
LEIIAGKLPVHCESRYKQVKLVSMHTLSIYQYYFRSIFSLLTGFDNPFNILKIFSDTRPAISKSWSVCLKKKNITFFVRHAMDVWSIKETFLDDFYRFEKNTKLDKGTIIDVGAGIGEFAIQAAKACPGCQVFGFEPFPESFRYFQKNIRSNNLTNAFPIEAAVTSVPGSMALDTTSGNPLQFRTQLDAPSAVSVKTMLLIDFLKEKSIDIVELLKLDCEGGEFNILLPLTIHDLARFQRIVMEYHDSLTIHHHEELVSLLENAGFVVEVVPNVVHQDIGYIYAQLNQ